MNRLPILLLLLALLPTSPVTHAADEAVPRLFERANTWHAVGRDDLAREALEKLFRVRPDHPGALALLAAIEQHSGNRSAAMAALLRLRQLHPGSPYTTATEQFLEATGPRRAELRQARLLARSGRVEEALVAWQRLLGGEPAPGPLAAEYVALLEAAGRREEAMGLLRRLLQHYPANLRYRLRLARLEAHRPLRRGEAIRTLRQLTRYPQLEREARSAWRRAVLAIEEDRLAIPWLEAYLEEDPRDTAVRERLAQARAAEAERRRLARDPIWIALQEGLRRLDRGDLEGAERKLLKVVEAWPRHGQALGSLGLVRLRQGRHQEAIDLFRRALRNDEKRRQGKWRALLRTARYWGLLKEAGRAEESGDLATAERRLREALAIDLREATGIARLGRVRAARGEAQEAERLFRRALDLEPDNTTALRGLVALYRGQGRVVEALALLDGLEPKQRRALGEGLGPLRAALLRDLADRHLAAGDTEAARLALLRAIQADPTDPWPRYDLARLYARTGEPERGVELFRRGVGLRPDDPEMRYAHALYLASLDREPEALAQLDAIPEERLSAKHRRARLRFWAITRQREAERLARSGDRGAARRVLKLAEERVVGDAEAAAPLATAWERLGEAGRAAELWERVIAAQPAPDPVTLIRYAEALHEAGRERKAREVVSRLRTNLSLAPETLLRLDRLDGRLTVAEARALRERGEVERARALLTEAIRRLPRLAFLSAELARLETRNGNPRAAIRHYRRAIALAPDDADYRIALIELLLQEGERDAVRLEISAARKRLPAAAVAERLELVLLEARSGDRRSARRHLRALLQAHPADRRVLLAAARLHAREEENEEALHLYGLALLGEREGTDASWSAWAEEAPRDRAEEVNRVMRKESWRLTAGLHFGWRSATDGLSSLDALEIPVEGWMPFHKGHLFVHLEPVRLDAGNLDVADPDTRILLGTNLFCSSRCGRLPAAQNADGTALAVGYRDDRWRLDIGTTPRGFPVSYLVGGIEMEGDVGDFGWRADLSRRPVTGSLLSYAGAIDPNSGRPWGGVRATGLTLSLSYDQGGPWGAWSNLGVHRLSGREVADNDRIRLLGGLYRKLIREEDQRLSVALNTMLWYHSENLGEFTWGHGGYYSPRSYLSLSLPVDWYARTRRWSWELRASVSYSFSSTDDAPWFPSDDTLQAAAEALTPNNGIEPWYTGGPGRGMGYSLMGAIEYRINRRLHIGARAEMERADYYSPNRAILYLRYTTRPDLGPLPMPPEPTIPLADF